MQQTTKRHRISTILLVFLLFTVGGCGGGAANVPVSGKVSLNGKTLTSGSVSYHPDQSKGNTGTVTAVGPIGADGSYRLITGAKDGAPAGWYKVTVTASVPSDPKDEYSVPKSLVHKKFSESGTTPLSVEVKPGAAAPAYDLTVTP